MVQGNLQHPPNPSQPPSLLNLSQKRSLTAPAAAVDVSLSECSLYLVLCDPLLSSLFPSFYLVFPSTNHSRSLGSSSFHGTLSVRMARWPVSKI